MRYVIIDNTGAITHIIHSTDAISSLEQLRAMPAFADEVIDFSYNQVILLPGDSNIDGSEIYNAATGEFEQPPASRQAIITRLQLMQRLNAGEKALLIRPDKVTGMTDDVEIMLSVFAEQIKMANEINLDDPEIVSGLTALEAAGLIAAGRADEIREL